MTLPPFSCTERMNLMRHSSLLFLDKVGARISFVLAVFAGITLTAMMMLACWNMVGRAIGYPLKGTFELMGFMGAVVAAFSLAYAQQSRSHIFVAFFIARFKRPVRLALDAAVHLASAAFFIHAGLELEKLAAFIVDMGELSETLQIVYHPFVWAVCVGCFAMGFVLFISFLKTVLLAEEV